MTNVNGQTQPDNVDACFTCKHAFVPGEQAFSCDEDKNFGMYCESCFLVFNCDEHEEGCLTIESFG